MSCFYRMMVFFPPHFLSLSPSLVCVRSVLFTAHPHCTVTVRTERRERETTTREQGIIYDWCAAFATLWCTVWHSYACGIMVSDDTIWLAIYGECFSVNNETAWWWWRETFSICASHTIFVSHGLNKTKAFYTIYVWQHAMYRSTIHMCVVEHHLQFRTKPGDKLNDLWALRLSLSLSFTYALILCMYDTQVNHIKLEL